MADLKRLTEVFREAGAPEPENWARSEVEEGIPQLARYLFLRGAWKAVLTEDDVRWIDAYRKSSSDPDAPLAGVGPALDRLLGRGIDPRDLTDVVRAMQYEVLFAICYLMDESFPATGDLEDPSPELTSVGWGLFETDEEERPLRRIGGLHESALGMDPTGREMRPRGRTP